MPFQLASYFQVSFHLPLTAGDRILTSRSPCCDSLSSQHAWEKIGSIPAVVSTKSGGPSWVVLIFTAASRQISPNIDRWEKFRHVCVDPSAELWDFPIALIPLDLTNGWSRDYLLLNLERPSCLALPRIRPSSWAEVWLTLHQGGIGAYLCTGCLILPGSIQRQPHSLMQRSPRLVIIARKVRYLMAA